MGTGPTIGQYQFEAWELPTEYGWMHSGCEGQAATRVQDSASRMAEQMITSGTVFHPLSPFVVQSPLHDAMEERRELDHRANLERAREGR